MPNKPFEVVGLDDSYTVLETFDNSGDARAWLNRYVAKEDAGGWNLIEIYDTRGEQSERLWFWERDAS